MLPKHATKENEKIVRKLTLLRRLADELLDELAQPAQPAPASFRNLYGALAHDVLLSVDLAGDLGSSPSDLLAALRRGGHYGLTLGALMVCLLDCARAGWLYSLPPIFPRTIERDGGTWHLTALGLDFLFS